MAASCVAPWGSSFVALKHLFFLVIQQEEECQCILQSAEGKRLSKPTFCVSLALFCCLFFSTYFPSSPIKITVQETCRATMVSELLFVCFVGVRWSERYGLIKEGAGGGAEA